MGKMARGEDSQVPHIILGPVARLATAGRFTVSRAPRPICAPAAPDASQLTHRWWWKAKLGDRHGQPCAVLARGKMNSILVAFADGHRVLTSRHAVRKLASG